MLYSAISRRRPLHICSVWRGCQTHCPSSWFVCPRPGKHTYWQE